MVRRRTVAGIVALLAGMLLAVGAASPALAESTSIPIPDFPRPVGVSPDGTRGYVAAAVGGGAPAVLTEFDTAADRVLRTTTITEPEPNQLVVSSDGSRLYLTNDDFGDGPIVVVDTATFTQVDTWTIPSVSGGADDGVAWGIAFDGAGNLWASIRNGGRIVELDPQTGAELRSYPVGGLPAGLVIDAARNLAYVAVSVGNQVARVDLATGAITTVEAFPVGTSPFALALAASGTRLWTGAFGPDGAISIIDTSADPMTVTPNPPIPGRQQMVLNGDGSLVYLALGGSAGVGVFDAATGAQLGAVAVGADPRYLAMMPDGVHAWVSNVLGASVSLIGPPIPQRPADASVVEGDTATFSAVARATVDALQWQASTDGGASWTDLAGETAPTLVVAATLAGDGTRYRFVATSAVFGSVPSDPATLTVAAIPSSPTVPPAPPAPPTLPATGVGLGPALEAAGAVSALGAVLALAAAVRRRARASGR